MNNIHIFFKKITKMLAESYVKNWLRKVYNTVIKDLYLI